MAPRPFETVREHAYGTDVFDCLFGSVREKRVGARRSEREDDTLIEVHHALLLVLIALCPQLIEGKNWTSSREDGSHQRSAVSPMASSALLYKVHEGYTCVKDRVAVASVTKEFGTRVPDSRVKSEALEARSSLLFRVLINLRELLPESNHDILEYRNFARNAGFEGGLLITETVRVVANPVAIVFQVFWRIFAERFAEGRLDVLLSVRHCYVVIACSLIRELFDFGDSSLESGDSAFDLLSCHAKRESVSRRLRLSRFVNKSDQPEFPIWIDCRSHDGVPGAARPVGQLVNTSQHVNGQSF